MTNTQGPKMTSQTGQGPLPPDPVVEEQNFFGAVLGGCFGAVLGAVSWAIVTYVTGYQIGWIAILVGWLAGLCVRWGGKGLDRSYQVVGALAAALGCALGNVFVYSAIVAKQENITVLNVVLHLDLPTMWDWLKFGFRPTDLIFYLIAIYEGWRFSFRRLDPTPQ